MIQVLICDNNIIFADWLKQQVKGLLPPPSTVSVCYSSEELRRLCQNDLPQIAVLDIHLDDSQETGISLARELFPVNSGTAVIFVTGYVEYLPDVYEANHVYCLRKPINQVYLERALKKALDAIPAAATIFSVHTEKSIQLIDMRDVLCVESFYRKLRIRMWNEAVECYGSISSLPAFVQDHMISCHKSFLVNPQYIRTMDRQKFLLKNGSSVPISRAKLSESRQAFLDYCAGHLER